MHDTFMQQKQRAWAEQWIRFRNDTRWLFEEWIYPQKLTDFRGKDVLDCGCGGGEHLNLIAPYCRSAVGVDLNTAAMAQRNLAPHSHISVIDADIATMNLGKTFDIVYSIGVLHHTDHPERAFANIARHCKPRGRLIVWVYSYEGNLLNRTLLEFFKRTLLRSVKPKHLVPIAKFLTAFLYVPIYTLYLFTPRSLGEVGLPFYEYFGNFRKLPYRQNLLNVFDKLNAPQTAYIRRQELSEWFTRYGFTDIHISCYRGVSYRGSGTKYDAPKDA